jgi:uncharacterized membrane protein YgcG
MGNTQVIFAHYVTQWQRADVSGVVGAQLAMGAHEIRVTNGSMGCDPAPNCLKVLHIKYTHGGAVHERYVPENEVLHLRDGFHGHHCGVPPWWAHREQRTWREGGAFGGGGGGFGGGGMGGGSGHHHHHHGPRGPEDHGHGHGHGHHHGGR